jgi:hypothetical protein
LSRILSVASEFSLEFSKRNASDSKIA